MDKVHEFFLRAKRQERIMKAFFNDIKKNVIECNRQHGLEEYTFFSDCRDLETDDMYEEVEKVENSNGACVWLSNAWVNSNEPPKGVEMRNNRFPVRCVSLWYTPFSHMNGKPLDEFYEQAEKEKVLYQNWDVKISLIRRNAIPNRHSTQWHHKMSKPEYAMYLKVNKAWYEVLHAETLSHLERKAKYIFNDWR